MNKGMVVAHYIPFRAIRAGHQLSDSKGASAAISTEVALLAVHRSMNGFVGPADIFRNPQSIFRLNEPTKSDDYSPFDLVLSHSGNDFSVSGMHFKLGLYEHQSAGAIQALIDSLRANPNIVEKGVSGIKGLNIVIYEPAFGIIGDPAKRDPKTRQSADHSMVFTCVCVCYVCVCVCYLCFFFLVFFFRNCVKREQFPGNEKCPCKIV